MSTRLVLKAISNQKLRTWYSFLILALLFSLLDFHPVNAATTLTFAPSADSYIRENSPSSNAGTNTQLWVDGDAGAAYETYLKFTVTGLAGSVQSATLRVYATSSTVDGPLVYGTDTNWTETGLTWNARPARTSSGLDDKGAIATGVWVEYDVTPLVSSDGTFSFALVPTSTDSVSFSSRESSPPPQLVIVAGSGTVVTNTPSSQTATFTPTILTPTTGPSTTPTMTPTLSGPAASDEIHWTITGPNSVTVDWRGASNYLNYGLTTAYDQTATASAPSPMPFSSAGPFWEAKLTGLQPNTTYHYSIGGGADHTFKTALPKGNSGFMVDVIGDVGSTRTYPNVGPVQALIAADHPSFAWIVGDLTYANPFGQADADQHFNDVQVWSLDSTAYMPIWGNHEWDKEANDNLNNYKGRFDFPNPQTSPGSPAVSCCGEDWYYFDYGNVRFIAYPEPWTNDSWIDWNAKAITLMDEAQADPAITFIVTAGHRPAYSSGYHAGSTILQNYLGALGASHSKYVLNLNGHSHNYERTYPQNNVVHITAGTGGGNLEEVKGCLWSICTQPDWSAKRYFRQGVVRLSFTANSIQGEFVCGPAGGGTNDIACTPGQVIDSFTISSSGSTPTSTSTLSPTATFTSTPTATFTYTPTATLTPTATFTFTPTDTPTPTDTLVPTSTYTYTPTNTPSPTATFTLTPTATFTYTPTNIPSSTATFTFTPTATFTSTATDTPVPPTETLLPSTAAFTYTPTETPTATFTEIPTNTPSSTATLTSTATDTPVPPTATLTYTPTETLIPTATLPPTETFTATFTSTPTATFTFTPTSTHTPLPTATHTYTPTNTSSPTATLTFTPTATFTSTPTATFTYTPTATFTSTVTPTNTLRPITNTGFHVPTANNAVTSSAGDNNGYETTPANAYAADGLFAADVNSGTNSNTSCTNNGKDKHLFYNYTLNVPTSAAIQGIEVKLTGKVNNTSSAPIFCVQLSWDGGTTWTTAKSTSTLSTTNTTYTLGTSSDLWGRTWSGLNFSDANFRLRIIDVSGSTSRTFSLDAVAVQVTYR